MFNGVFPGFHSGWLAFPWVSTGIENREGQQNWPSLVCRMDSGTSTKFGVNRLIQKMPLCFFLSEYKNFLSPSFSVALALFVCRYLFVSLSLSLLLSLPLVPWSLPMAPCALPSQTISLSGSLSLSSLGEWTVKISTGVKKKTHPKERHGHHNHLPEATTGL